MQPSSDNVNTGIVQIVNLLRCLTHECMHTVYSVYYSDIFDAMFAMHRHAGEVIILQGLLALI